MVYTRKRTTRRKKKTSTAKATSTKKGTTSFMIEVPVRDVSYAKAKRIKADAKKKLTGAKFRKI